jgi:dolichyl-phosphate beta-glucosyltransferase
MSRAIVVVPCYNEAKRLNLRAIQDFGRRAENVELLFVNDGSRDETLELLEHLHGNNPRSFSFLHLAKNGGKAEAVRQGFLRALRSDADYIGFWDADLATPLAQIEPFCRVLDTHPAIEAVIGTRLRLMGHKIERHWLRQRLGRLFARTASLALGAPFFDTQCGAKLFRASGRLEYCFARPFLTRWIFDVEVFARMHQLRSGSSLPALAERIYEFPLDSWRDVAGSTLKKGDFVKAVAELAAIYWTYLRPGAHPPAPLPSMVGRMAVEPASKTPGGDQRAA